MKYLKHIKKDLKEAFSIEAFKRVGKLYFKPVVGFINFIKCINDDKFGKLATFADTIERITVNDNNDLMIEFKNSFVLKTNGHQVYYTKDGTIITSGLWTSENPEFNVDPYINSFDINNLIIKDRDTIIEIDEKMRKERFSDFFKNMKFTERLKND